MATGLQLAVNEAVNYQRQRLDYLRMAGIDNKRPGAYAEYGYKETLEFDDFYRLYQRGGVAHGAVSRLIEKCWETSPWVIQGDEFDDKRPLTQWENALAQTFKRVKVWRAFMEGDKRRLVGHYSGLLLQVTDNQPWHMPLSPKVGGLLRVLPAWEGQLKPSTWDENPASPTYGEVSMWDFQEARVVANDSTHRGRAVQIHPSRVVVLGDIRDGEPFLQAGFNDCVNLEKILGGAGESFLKNAARQMAVEYDKDVDLGAIATAHGVGVAELQQLFNEQARDLNRGIDSLMVLQGGTAKPLVATVPDPEPPFNVTLASFAASVRMPVKVLVGMQTGERASTEDLRDFNRRGQGRRVNVLSNDIETLVGHLVRYRLIDAPPGGQFAVMWDDLAEASLEEKLANADKMASVNQKSIATGEAVFSTEEIRDIGGFDNDEAPEPLGEVE